MDSPTPKSFSKPNSCLKLFLIVIAGLCAILIVASITFGLLQLIKSHDIIEPETSTIPSVNTETSYSSTTDAGCVQNSYSVYVDLMNTSIIHVWMKPKRLGSTAILYANISNTNQTTPTPIFYTSENGKPTWFDFAQLELNFNGKVELSWSEKDTNVSYIYAYETENVKRNGIRPAFVSKLAMGPNMEQSFHFRPPLGWTNDPNGFSRTKDGLYHLYYQHYPHSKQWNSMYWGHAISTDLVNWIHQPIFLRPDDKECGNDCGLFSGSAVPIHDGDGLQVFFTDNNNTRINPEIQRTVYTKDTILPYNESEIIIHELPDLEEKGLKLGADFRDPNVFLGPEGYYYMTLGSSDTLGAGGVVLLYRSKEKHSVHSGWIFQNVLKTDNAFETKVCECSQIFQLGGRRRLSQTLYALLYARTGSKDGDGRANLSPIILGNFDGSNFNPIEEQELDFGAGSFGFQAFYDTIDDEALLIGWLANWPDWDRISDWSTSLTLPWVIRWNNRQLLIGPHPNVLGQLRDIELDGKALLRGNAVVLPNGTAYIRLALEYYYFYNGIFLQLNHPDYIQLGVKVSKDGLEIVKVKHNDPPNRRFLAADARPDIVHIYIDRDSLEVFGEMKNDGMPRWAGTSRLTGLNTFVESVQLSTTDRYSYLLQGCQIWSMKPAKFLGRL
ncbi:unnamed protein product [Meloidogyne enterolobii]|uniref:Uncharacterized protein n=1 Tax=Meloidogyne enterolobii TaxID=390850 RepID=A0ACB1B5D2_MELEN